MLRDAARRYLADDFALRRSGNNMAQNASWHGYAELGWLALMAPEVAGGLGGDIADVLVLTEEMGRALSPQPYIWSAILATGLVELAASDTARLELMASIASGERRISPALYEPGRRYRLEPETRATKSPMGYRLSGEKCLVLGGGDADVLIVSARLEGNSIALFTIPADHAGVFRTRYETIDDGDAMDVRFEQVALGDDALLAITSAEAIDDVIDKARLALCADALGALQGAVEMTAEYLKTRTQFGQPLANFQALQHSIVEMYIEVDLIRSGIFNALAAYQRGIRAECQRAVSSCWVKTFDAAKDIAGMAVHLHGGIGMTTEYPVGHHLRRVMVSERSLGNVEQHFARYMELGSSRL